MKSRSQNTSKQRDDKIKNIKRDLEQNARLFNERETERIMREFADRENKLKELEMIRKEEMKRREEAFR